MKTPKMLSQQSVSCSIKASKVIHYSSYIHLRVSECIFFGYDIGERRLLSALNRIAEGIQLSRNGMEPMPLREKGSYIWIYVFTFDGVIFKP